MKKTGPKLRLIYFPYLLMVAGFIAGYSLLHWGLVLYTGWIPLYGELTEFWLPLLLPWIIILFSLRPRLLLLDFSSGRRFFFCQLCAGLIIAILTMVFQDYLVDESKQLKQVPGIHAIADFPKEEYFAFKKFYPDKNNITFTRNKEADNGKEYKFNFSVTVCMPLRPSAKDTAGLNCTAVIAREYKTTVSRLLSNSYAETLFEEYTRDCLADFRKINWATVQYFHKPAYDEKWDGLLAAALAAPCTGTDDPNLLFPFFESFEKRNEENLHNFLLFLVLMPAAWFLFLLSPQLNMHNLHNYLAGIKPEDDLHETLDFFIPRGKYVITPVLISLSLIAWLMLVLSGYGFALWNPDMNGQDTAVYTGITDHNFQWWQLLTGLILQIDLLHLAVHLILLWHAGSLLEGNLGKTRFVLIYVLAGFTGMLTSYAWFPETVSSGATGAVMGCCGALLVLWLKLLIPVKLGERWLKKFLPFFVFYLLPGPGGFNPAMPMAGLLMGALLGWLFIPFLKKKKGMA
jgi:rhomboid protease GluP